MNRIHALVQKGKYTFKKNPLYFSLPASLVLIVILYWVFYGRFIESTDNAYVRGDMTPIAAKVSGYVKQISFDEGMETNPGDLLIQIDPEEYQEQLNRAFGEVQEMLSNIKQLDIKCELSNLEIPKAEYRLTSAKEEYSRATNSYQRSGNLVKNNFASKEKLDDSKAQFTSAESLFKEAKIQLELTKLSQENVKIDRSRAEHTLAIKQANLNLARMNLDYTAIKSPVKGIIGNRSCRIGQYVSPGVILMYVVPLDKVWVIANFKETQVSRMKPQQKVKIEIDAFPGKSFEGTVDAISPASGAEFSLLPADNATGNFTKVVQRVPVKILIDKPDGYRIVPGMSAYVKVYTNS